MKIVELRNNKGTPREARSLYVIAGYGANGTPNRDYNVAVDGEAVNQVLLPRLPGLRDVHAGRFPAARMLIIFVP